MNAWWHGALTVLAIEAAIPAALFLADFVWRRIDDYKHGMIGGHWFKSWAVAQWTDEVASVYGSAVAAPYVRTWCLWANWRLIYFDRRRWRREHPNTGAN